jgi:hypothetical protein
MTASSTAAPYRLRGRVLLFLGLGLALVGVLAYVVQLSLQQLIAPWYMPVLATLGVVFIGASMLELRTIWRAIALVVVVLLAGAEWAFMYAVRLPRYTGPVVVGQPFPAFELSRADGTPFSQRDLAGDQNNVLVFFRGRW